MQLEIRAAFPESGVPPTVVKPSVHELTHPGVDAVRRTFESRRWPQVNLAHSVEEIGDTLAFLTLEAYSYYLPAFLWWILDQQFAGSYLCGTFLEQINPRNASEEIAETYMNLTAQQQRLVALCLAQCWSTAHLVAALSALEDFWDLFLTDSEKREVHNSPEAIRLNRRFMEIAASNKKRIQ